MHGLIDLTLWLLGRAPPVIQWFRACCFHTLAHACRVCKGCNSPPCRGCVHVPGARLGGTRHASGQPPFFFGWTTGFFFEPPVHRAPCLSIAPLVCLQSFCLGQEPGTGAGQEPGGWGHELGAGQFGGVDFFFFNLSGCNYLFIFCGVGLGGW